MDGWIMLGIMVFVIVAQGLLWSWVLIERRRKVPDVKVMNLRELYDAARQGIDGYYKRMRASRRR
jgi:hypothetical protein